MWDGVSSSHNGGLGASPRKIRQFRSSLVQSGALSGMTKPVILSEPLAYFRGAKFQEICSLASRVVNNHSKNIHDRE